MLITPNYKVTNTIIPAFKAKDEQILNNDGTYSFIPNRMIFIGALVVGILLIISLNMIFFINISIVIFWKLI